MLALPVTMLVVASQPHGLHVAAGRLNYLHWFIPKERAGNTSLLPSKTLLYSAIWLWKPDLETAINDLEHSIPDLRIIRLTSQTLHVGLVLKAYLVHQTPSQLAYGIGTIVKANAECEAESDVTGVPMTTGSSDVAAFR